MELHNLNSWYITSNNVCSFIGIGKTDSTWNEYMSTSKPVGWEKSHTHTHTHNKLGVYDAMHVPILVRFEVFTANEFNEVFSGDWPFENGVVIWRFGNCLCLCQPWWWRERQYPKHNSISKRWSHEKTSLLSYFFQFLILGLQSKFSV
jgi:hypothetical protein